MTTRDTRDLDGARRQGGGVRSWLAPALGILAGLAVLSMAACSDPLEVNDPDIAQPGQLSGPEGLEAQLNGAIGDFAQAYGGNSTGGGGTEGQILATALFTDEMKHSGTFPTRVEMDARRVRVRNGTLGNFFYNLHRARRSAERTARAYTQSDSVEAVDQPVALLQNLAGYSYVFFGETFCAGVPFSRVTETGDLEYGDGMSTQEMFSTAISRFDQASSRAQNAGAQDLQYLSQVGRARALLNQGQYQPAADAVSGVPTDWEYEVQYSTNTARQENGTMTLSAVFERYSVVNEEGGGIDYMDAYMNGDPRTPWTVAPDSAGFDTAVLMFYELKYPQRDSPIPLANGIEARLIEAEAALQQSDPDAFEQIHNDLRARLDTSAVGPIESDTMSMEQMVDFHFRERALWLWLTGHRLGDMRRLVRQYGRSASDVYPTGEYFKAQYGTYGDQVVFPIPFEETNNPNFETCTNTNA